jgi:hypothetical protein
MLGLGFRKGDENAFRVGSRFLGFGFRVLGFRVWEVKR